MTTNKFTILTCVIFVSRVSWNSKVDNIGYKYILPKEVATAAISAKILSIIISLNYRFLRYNDWCLENTWKWSSNTINIYDYLPNFKVIILPLFAFFLGDKSSPHFLQWLLSQNMSYFLSCCYSWMISISAISFFFSFVKWSRKFFMSSHLPLVTNFTYRTKDKPDLSWHFLFLMSFLWCHVSLTYSFRVKFWVFWIPWSKTNNFLVHMILLILVSQLSEVVSTPLGLVRMFYSNMLSF